MLGTACTGTASLRTKKAGGEKSCVICGESSGGLEEVLEWGRSIFMQGVAARESCGSCESCGLLPGLCSGFTGCEEAASVQDSEQGEVG